MPKTHPIIICQEGDNADIDVGIVLEDNEYKVTLGDNVRLIHTVILPENIEPLIEALRVAAIFATINQTLEELAASGNTNAKEILDRRLARDEK